MAAIAVANFAALNTLSAEDAIAAESCWPRPDGACYRMLLLVVAPRQEPGDRLVTCCSRVQPSVARPAVHPVLPWRRRTGRRRDFERALGRHGPRGHGGDLEQARRATSTRALHLVRREVLHTAGEGGGLRGLKSNVRRVRALRRVIEAFRPDIVLDVMTCRIGAVGAGLRQAGIPVSSPRNIPCRRREPVRILAAFAAPDLSARRAGWCDPRHAQWLERHVPEFALAVIPNPVHWPLPQGQDPC